MDRDHFIKNAIFTKSHIFVQKVDLDKTYNLIFLSICQIQPSLYFKKLVKLKSYFWSFWDKI